MARIFELGPARIDSLSFDEALKAVLDAAEGPGAKFVVTPNSDHMVMLEERADLRAVYADAFLRLADGMPIVWASRWLGEPLPERVTGAEMMPKLCEQAAARRMPVFFLGAAEGVAVEAKRRLEAQYPGLHVSGTYSPPLGFEKNAEENRRIHDMIEASGARLIFVGLGAPKQELWIHQNYKNYGHGVFLAIGAAIDFCAGQVKRAPPWMQKSGLEWVYRLLQEPRRLAGRYLKDTRVLLIIWREKQRRKTR